MAATPPPGPADGRGAPLPRQPGPRDQRYPGPAPQGAPTARFAAQRGPSPAEASRLPGPGGGPPVPGAGGGLPSLPGDRYPARADQYGVPGGQPTAPRDRHPGRRDPYGASDGYGARDGHDVRGRTGGAYGTRDGYGAPGGYGARDDYDASGARGARDHGAPAGYEAPARRGARDHGVPAGRRGRDGHGAPDDYEARDERAAQDDFDDFWSTDDGAAAGGRDGWDSGDDGGDRPPRPKRRRRRGRWAGLIAVLAILIPLAVGAIFAYRVIAGKFFPADYSGAGTGSIIVQIKPGDTATSVGARLQALGVVASARAFVLAAEHSSNPSGLQPGSYRLHKQMNATLAYSLLLKPSSRVQLTVTIPEGLRQSQILTALGRDSGISLADYQQVLRHPGTLGLPPYAHGNPEGYLYPATYTIQPGMTATTVLQAMVRAFNQEAAGVNLPRAAAQAHLTPAQVIVVASLAQAEGGKISDFPKITRVIYNRLAAGMPLQLDSTVLYALHTYGILASNQQLNVSSPYNTYANKGLPPGPIDSPGDAAIRAALHPASGNWMYFVTVNPKTRQTDFTSSPAVFNQLRAELARNLGQG